MNNIICSIRHIFKLYISSMFHFYFNIYISHIFQVQLADIIDDQKAAEGEDDDMIKAQAKVSWLKLQ